MTNQMIRSLEVTNFLESQNHPLRKEIEELRNVILSSNKHLAENIKWNAPNYCFGNEDRITMKIQPVASNIQLIFHRGAKKKEQPKERLIANKNKILIWKENDRAIIAFKNSKEIESAKAELKTIINEWIIASQS
jgi:guanylate kinase